MIKAKLKNLKKEFKKWEQKTSDFDCLTIEDKPFFSNTDIFIHQTKLGIMLAYTSILELEIELLEKGNK